jgi:hypothetical protein
MFHIDNWFHYNEEFDILICTPCGIVVMPNQGGGVKGHLEGSHNGRSKNFPLSSKERRELVQLHGNRILKPNPRIPRHDSLPIPHLPVHSGVYCLKCLYACIADTMIQRHMREEHDWVKKDGMSTLTSPPS